MLDPEERGVPPVNRSAGASLECLTGGTPRSLRAVSTIWPLDVWAERKVQVISLNDRPRRGVAHPLEVRGN